MQRTVSIFLTLLVFLVGGNFAVARNQESSASLGDLCAFAVQTHHSEEFHRQDAKEDKLFQTDAPGRITTYDLLGRRTGSTAKNKLGSVLSSEGYSYDIRSQLTGYTGPNGSIGYGYDANGNLNGVGYANGVQHAYIYNALNRLTDLAIRSRDLTVPSSSYIPLQGHSYQLNKNGHRTQISELSGRSISNTFDALHRLTAESIFPSQPPTLNSQLSYTYDSVGNRASRTTTRNAALTSLLPNQSQFFTVNNRLTTDTQESLQQRAVGKADGEVAMIEAGEVAGDVGPQGKHTVFREAFQARGGGAVGVDSALGESEYDEFLFET